MDQADVGTRDPTVGQGVIAGLLAGASVALFFLVLDAVSAEVLRTPTVLAAAVFGQAPASVGAGLIAAFTGLHLAVFAALGAGAVTLFRWAGLPQNVTSGALYGIFVFSLLFYVSLMVTGTEVFPASWWPAALVGNLVAGVVLGGYLHWIGPRPGVLGLQEGLDAHPVLREGILAGLLGAVAVAGWFLVVDFVAREPLWTPAALGSALFQGVSNPEAVRITASTVLGYTVLHLGGFLLVGAIAAGLVAQAEKFPPLVFALLLLLVVFEVFFIGLTVALGEWILESLAWWSVFVGNLLAAGAMGGYLWRSHPILQEKLRSGAAWGREPGAGGPR